jgi:hypothetical protein
MDEHAGDGDAADDGADAGRLVTAMAFLGLWQAASTDAMPTSFQL